MKTKDCVVILLQPGGLVAQATRSPEDLLKEAQSLNKAGKLDQAIEDYRLFFAQYPDVVQVLRLQSEGGMHPCVTF